MWGLLLIYSAECKNSKSMNKKILEWSVEISA